MDGNFLGWKFPTVFNKYGRKIQTTSSINESIKESLYVLLNTTPGERLMELEYGCNIKSIAFKPLDLNLKTYISNNIKSSINRWEDRIEVVNIDVESVKNEGVINIKIEYVIKINNTTDMLDFDYKF